MNHRLSFLLIASLALLACDDDADTTAPTHEPWQGYNVVRVETSMGNVDIELYRDEAPITTVNFMRYVRDRFYDGRVFHRVIYNFVVQAGQYDEFMAEKTPTYPPIQNEAGNGLSNLRGTVGMARTSDPQSATCGFYINTKDNLFLDHKDDTPQGYGYAVFGRVKSGMDVVDAMSSVPTGPYNGFNDVPVTPIIIEKMTFLGRLRPE